MTSAQAGGFAVREQSTSGLGSAFAGAAAGYDLSSMFWNPAAAGAFDGRNIEMHMALILPDSEITPLPGSTILALNPSKTAIDSRILLPSTYSSMQINDKIVVGLAVNTPFGLVTEPEDRTYAGQYHGRTAKLATYDVNPNVAFRVSPKIIVGAGVQLVYADLKLKTNPSFAPPNSPNSALNGDDRGVGFTLGALFKPTPATQIGIGFRSKVELDIEGTAKIAGTLVPVATPIGPVLLPFQVVNLEAGLDLPEIATFSFRHAVTPNARILGTVEWTNWDRLDIIPVIARSRGGLAVAPILPGQTLTTLDFQWEDGWFYSLGGEVDLNKKLTMRAGVAYEESPVDDPSQRTPVVPDNDRLWLSIGATYKWRPNITLDFAYSHLFFDDDPIDRDAPVSASTGLGVTNVDLIADVDTAVDIIAVSMKIKLGGGHEEPAPPPLK
ncbi:MAG: OmpP1/FadL family transporter [Methyloligellaceae bacterium]